MGRYCRKEENKKQENSSTSQARLFFVMFINYAYMHDGERKEWITFKTRYIISILKTPTTPRYNIDKSSKNETIILGILHTTRPTLSSHNMQWRLIKKDFWKRICFLLQGLHVSRRWWYCLKALRQWWSSFLPSLASNSVRDFVLLLILMVPCQ